MYSSNVVMMRNQSTWLNLRSWFNLLFMKINIGCLHCISDCSLRVSYFQSQIAIFGFNPIVDLAHWKTDCLVPDIVFLSPMNHCWTKPLSTSCLLEEIMIALFECWYETDVGHMSPTKWRHQSDILKQAAGCRKNNTWFTVIYLQYGIWKILDNVAKRYSKSS